MCLCALTTGANFDACGIGWKVFRKSSDGSRYLNWYHQSRHIELIPHKLLDANPTFAPIDLECFVTDDDTMLKLTKKLGMPAMTYREGFHIYSCQEDAAKMGGGAVRPVWWFGLNAAGYDGYDGKSLRPVIVARYMVFFDQEGMPDISNTRLQSMWKGIRERGKFDETFKQELSWGLANADSTRFGVY